MMQLVFFLGCAVLLASAADNSSSSSSSSSSEEDLDIGEYGHYSTWREAICKKNSPEMMEEMETCFEMEPKIILDASVECSKEAYPASEGKINSFVKAACKDKSIFMKFDECFEDYKRNPMFRKQMEISEEIEISPLQFQYDAIDFFLRCAVLLASAADNSSSSSEEDEDIGEYGKYSTWREAVCKKNSQEMMEEMEACFQMEPKIILDAYAECSKEGYPASEGKTILFLKAACKDKSIFMKFDDCFDDYRRNPMFQKQMEITDEIEKCYETVKEKYGLDNLQKNMKELSSEG